MTSVAEIKTPQEYADQHKRAFREGFNFLNAHFPPVFDNAWWEKCCQDVLDVMNKDPGNDMLMQMMVGVVTYLEDESRKRKVDINGTTA